MTTKELTKDIGINGRIVSEQTIDEIAAAIVRATDKAEWNDAVRALARVVGAGCVLNSAPPPPEPDGYVDGAILSCSWGFEQTNVDFYRIAKRSGDWVKLQKLTKVFTETGDMVGKVVPLADDANEPAFRRKLAIRDGNPSGCAFQPSYGWISMWDGTPQRVSWYG